jgi:hypothetical protein
MTHIPISRLPKETGARGFSILIAKIAKIRIGAVNIIKNIAKS